MKEVYFLIQIKDGVPILLHCLYYTIQVGVSDSCKTIEREVYHVHQGRQRRAFIRGLVWSKYVASLSGYTTVTGYCILGWVQNTLSSKYNKK